MAVVGGKDLKNGFVLRRGRIFFGDGFLVALEEVREGKVLETLRMMVGLTIPPAKANGTVRLSSWLLLNVGSAVFLLDVPPGTELPQ